MPSSQPTVDKISCDAEIEPSVGCDEGTGDHLNNGTSSVVMSDECRLPNGKYLPMNMDYWTPQFTF